MRGLILAALLALCGPALAGERQAPAPIEDRRVDSLPLINAAPMSGEEPAAVTAPAHVSHGFIEAREAAPVGTPLGPPREAPSVPQVPATAAELESRIEALTLQHNELRQRFGPDHPDVRSAKAAIFKLARQREQTSPARFAAGTFDFKGVVLGAPSPAFPIRDKFDATCTAEGDALICKGVSTIVERPANVAVTLRKGRVYAMTIAFESWQRYRVEEALRAKFGEPNDPFAWYNAAGDTVFIVDTDTFDSVLHFSSAAELQDIATAAEQAKKDAAAARQRANKDL